MIKSDNNLKQRTAHLEFSNRGKVQALNGDHLSALKNYQDAIRIAVSIQEPEVIFRHYMECALESLEHLRSFDQIQDYCERAIAHYDKHPLENSLARKDLASIYERYGITLLKKGLKDDSKDALEIALNTSSDDLSLKLCRTLIGWINQGWHITIERIEQEQHKLNYFSVR